jgi:hypothetical protein
VEALSEDTEEEEEEGDAEEELCSRECGPGIQALEEEDTPSMRVKRRTKACTETYEGV